VADLLESAEGRFRCPGCGRVIDGSDLRPGQLVKCTKCKKLMRFGPQLFDPATRSAWRTVRLVLVVACVAATVWCVTTGYAFGSRTGRWVAGLGGSLVVWLIAVGCIALAARASQNNGVLVGVTAMMAGVSLFFIERLGDQVAPAEVAAWRQYQFYGAWVPLLLAGGAAVFLGALVVQARAKPV